MLLVAKRNSLGLGRILALLLILIVACTATAQEQQTMLIINSYNENAPWSQSFAAPINKKMAEYTDVRLEMISLNSAEIKDKDEYDEVTDCIFTAFADKPPQYVIMIGSFGISLRDRIKREWGDIPILLISRIDRYAPIEYYFAGYTGPRDWDKLPNIEDIRPEYNLTAIVTPDFCGENIELIHRLLPDMHKLVFISDNVFANREIDLRLSRHLRAQYPNIEYEWLQASDTTLRRYQDYMLNKHEGTGLLISTWANIDHHPEMLGITGANLQLISSAANPIFSLRDSYLSVGALGGVFHNLDESSRALSYIIDNMLTGADMRTLPLYILDKPVTIINHQRMQSLGFNEDDFAKGTKYIFHAPTLWEAHRSIIIAGALILLVLITAVVVYMSIQRKRINLLKTHALFIKNMPWAYSKAKIIYDSKGEISDIEFFIEDCNSAFMKLVIANALPRTQYKIFAPEFIAKKTKLVFETGHSVIFTHHFENTDTYYEILLCRINPTKLKVGEKPKLIDIFANNITSRIRAQKKLGTAMRTLDITLNVAHIIPWQWDLNKGQIRYSASGSARLLQDDPTEYHTSQPHYTVDVNQFLTTVHADDYERIRRLIDEFTTGHRRHVHTEFKISMERSGKLRTDWAEVNAAVSEQNDDGTSRLVLGSLVIITERKRQEQALIDAKERASESDRLKSAFLANMSHEIRTPLNAIVGFSSLITQTDDPEEKKHYCTIIEKNNQLLLRLIDDVLDMAKIESNTMQLQSVDTDLNELMRTVYDTVRLRIAKGVKFNVTLACEECYLRTDPNRLSQLMITLLTNAAKFTTEGSITYGYELKGEMIEFYVRDTGIGIPVEDQQKLFQRFRKLNDFVQGSGLGLSICKSFVEKMGGTIGVKSRGEGKGSTFWFTLPYVEAQRAKALEPTEAIAIQNPVSDNSEITLLVAMADDNTFAYFDSILTGHYKLVRAHNGQQAIALYRKHKPNLILTDIVMPEVDGYGVMREIRKMSQTVPIIAVTARTSVTERDRIMKCGFNGYVSASIDPKQLLDTIKAQLSKRIFVF